MPTVTDGDHKLSIEQETLDKIKSWVDKQAFWDESSNIRRTTIEQYVVAYFDASENNTITINETGTHDESVTITETELLALSTASG